MVKKRDTLGARMRAARLAAGLSQTELADRSGIPKPTLSRYENDHVLPSIPTLRRVARAMGHAVSELLTASDRCDEPLADALRRRGIEIRSLAQAERIVDLIEENLTYRREAPARRTAAKAIR